MAIDILDRDISSLGLDVRAINCLKAEGVRTVGDILRFTEIDLLKFPNLGRVTLSVIVNALSQHQLHLRVPEPRRSVRDDGGKVVLDAVTTLRDYFAGLALPAIIQAGDSASPISKTQAEIFALDSYAMADAMILARSKR